MKFHIKKNGKSIRLAAGFFTILVGENFEYRLSFKMSFLKVQYFDKDGHGSWNLKNECIFQKVVGSAEDEARAQIKDWKPHGPGSMKAGREEFCVYRSKKYSTYCRVDVRSLAKDGKRQSLAVLIYKRMWIDEI